MRLGLSSAAAPTLAADELFAACARRGIGAVELVEGHGHGIAPGATEGVVEDVLRLARGAGVRIVAFRAADGPGGGAAGAAAARLSGQLTAPVIAPPGSLGPAAVAAALPRYAAQGGRLLLAHGSDPAEAAALRLLLGDAFLVGGLAWDVAPATGGPLDARAVLGAAGAWLGHIRLSGGGPEAAGQEGRGIGDLAVQLLVRSYPGAVALAPSTRRFLTAWSFWLGRRGWGCGSAESALAVLPRGGVA